MRTVLVTNVTQYAGAGAVSTMLGQGERVVCHDPSFADPAVVAAFEFSNPGAVCLRATDAAGIACEIAEREIDLDACVSNDVYPIRSSPVGEIDLADLRATFEAVLVFPVQLAQLLLPAMRARGGGTFVFVTSARPLRPEAGYSVPTAIRSGTTAFALSMAKEVARDGIQVNVVAPNYLYSELYYPREKFVDDPAGKARIAELVPMGRLGSQDEVGELIAFLASGRAAFVTGQVIYFTGGWP